MVTTYIVDIIINELLLIIAAINDWRFVRNHKQENNSYKVTNIQHLYHNNIKTNDKNHKNPKF